jgi:iron complex outermembrane receptor protein
MSHRRTVLLRRLIRVVAVTVPFLLSPTTLHGQATGSGERREGVVEPSDTTPVFTLAGVTVSALRAPLAAVRSPVAVSALGPRTLRTGKAGLFFTEALEAVPGVQLQNRFNDAVGERLSIRGFGARAQFGIRGVRVLVDGVPATMPDGQSTLDHVDLGSLGRVEALRGPGSALYGNAAGGVLRFETQAPSTLGFDGVLTGVYGDNGLGRFQGVASGTSGATDYVVSVNHNRWTGFRTNPLEDDGSTYGESERTRVNGRVRWSGLGGEFSGVLNATTLEAQNPGSINDSIFNLGDRRAHTFNVIQNTRKYLDQAQLGLGWTGDVAGAETYVQGWGILRNVDTWIPSSLVDLDRKAGGLRVLAGTGQTARTVQVTGGLEGELQRDRRKNFRNERGEQGDLSLDQDEDVSAFGAFVQARWLPSDRGSLEASLRYDLARFSATDHFVSDSNPDGSGSRTMDAVSPALAGFLDLGRGVGLFGGVSTFFETPTASELANQPDRAGGFNPELEPTTGTSVEAGLRKADDPRYGGEVLGFWTRLENELVPFEVPDDPGRTFFRNAGSSRRVGAEVSGWTRVSWLTVRAAYSYTDATFDEYEVDGESFDGNRIPGLAPHRLEAVLEGRWGGLYGAAVGTWTSEIEVNDANTGKPADASTVLDLRVGWEGIQAGGSFFDLFAGLYNLTDTDYVSSVVVNGFGGRYYEPGPARSLYAGVSVRWGR